jgi:hypothetical protein
MAYFNLIPLYSIYSMPTMGYMYHVSRFILPQSPSFFNCFIFQFINIACQRSSSVAHPLCYDGQQEVDLLAASYYCSHIRAISLCASDILTALIINCEPLRYFAVN